MPPCASVKNAVHWLHVKLSSTSEHKYLSEKCKAKRLLELDRNNSEKLRESLEPSSGLKPIGLFLK